MDPALRRGKGQGGDDIPVADFSDALKNFFKGKDYAPPKDDAGHGDHLVLCIEDDKNPGKVLLKVLTDVPEARGKEVTLAGVPYTSRFLKGRAVARCVRDFADVVEVGEPDYKGGGASKALEAGREPTTAPELARPPVQRVWAGSSAQDLSLTKFGTVGWNIIYGGTLVCISNHHVLSKNQNPGSGVTDLLAGSVRAPLVRRQTAKFLKHSNLSVPVNHFDIGMAEYRGSAVGAAAAQTRTCPNYPMDVLPASTLANKMACHFSGASRPDCQSFAYEGKWTGRLHFFGKNAWFEEQLLFTANTLDQDSGAVIVDAANRVVGLHMMFVTLSDGSNHSMANPLYRASWNRSTPATGTIAGNPDTYPNFDPAGGAMPDCFDDSLKPE